MHRAADLALALPGVVEADHHGRPSFRVDGKIFATLWESDRLNIMLDPDDGRPAGGPVRRGCLILADQGGRVTGMALSDRDRAILDFERSWWTEPGSKHDSIRLRFELSATRYYQLLAGLVDDDDAISYEPLVVRRLRRVRDTRRRARFEGRSAPAGPGGHQQGPAR